MDGKTVSFVSHELEFAALILTIDRYCRYRVGTSTRDVAYIPFFMIAKGPEG